MPIQLVPLPQSEWHVYQQVAAAAFRPGILSVMYPNGISDAATEHSIASLKRTAERFPDRIHMFKAVDSDLPDDDPYDKVVGVSQWKIFPKERSEDEIQAEEEWDQAQHEQYGWPEGIDIHVVEDFFGQTKEYKKKHLGRQPYILLHVLATRPDQGRKGVGAVSMSWGASKADEMGVPLYLEGSPMGVGLYKKWGFEVVDELPFDARKYGYPEPLTHLCMKRRPKTMQSVNS